MKLESRIKHVERAYNVNQRGCPECGRMKNGEFPPDAPEEIRKRRLTNDDGSSKMRCNTCGLQLLFLFRMLCRTESQAAESTIQ